MVRVTNGDQLTGKVVSETGGVVTFQSDMAGKADGSGGGTITVPWSRIKELHSAQKYAIITKDQTLRVGKPAPQVQVGTVSYSNDEISISGGGSEIKNIPAKNAAYMVDDASFEKAMRQEPSILQGWHGAATLGASLVESTQTSRTFTGAIGPGADGARRGLTGATQQDHLRRKRSLLIADAAGSKYYLYFEREDQHPAWRHRTRLFSDVALLCSGRCERRPQLGSRTEGTVDLRRRRRLCRHPATDADPRCQR
jgi:hypothetical protein